MMDGPPLQIRTAKLAVDQGWRLKVVSESLCRFDFCIWHRHEDQDAEDDYDEAERARHAIPFLRLPHAEPLAADRHKTDLPQQQAERQAQDRERLSAIEPRCLGAEVENGNTVSMDRTC